MEDTHKKQLEEIAKKHLKINTLETRYGDEFDFYDMAVWCIKDALEAAYELGLEERQK